MSWQLENISGSGDERWLSATVRNSQYVLASIYNYSLIGGWSSFWPTFYSLFKRWMPPSAVAAAPPNSAQLVMLGPSRSGKTCFLATMYNVLESGVRGCSLSTVDLDQGVALNELFQTLRRETGDERWPLPTLERVLFQFDFNVHHRKLVSFDWLDYRGGALKEKSTEEEVQGLLQHLGGAFAILIAVDGEILKNTAHCLDADDALGVKRINQFLRRAGDATAAAGRNPPLVCLVITKGDAIMSGDEGAKAEITSAVKQLYNGLTVEGSGWDVHMTAVSLGDGLHGDKQLEIQPIAVHEPVIFIAMRWCEQELVREEARTRMQREELHDWLAFAERHKEGDFNHQQKMAEFKAHVNSLLQPYEASLAVLRGRLSLLKSLCGPGMSEAIPATH